MNKTCKDCGVTKPLSDYYHRNGNPFAECRVCNLKRQAVYRKKQDRSKYWKKRYSENKESIQSYNKEYYRKYRERFAERNKKYIEKNREKLYESNRLRYQENKEEYKEINDRWRANNTDKINANSAKRYALKADAIPPWLSKEDKENIKSIYSLCSKLTESTGTPHHVDHIVPLKGRNVCGLHVPWNLQVISAEENLSKGNRYDDWT